MLLLLLRRQELGRFHGNGMPQPPYSCNRLSFCASRIDRSLAAGHYPAADFTITVQGIDDPRRLLEVDPARLFGVIGTKGLQQVRHR